MQYVLADLESATDYFEQFAQNDPANPSFYFGTLDQVIAASRGDDDFRYPCLWLDLPTILTEQNEANNHMEFYNFQITAFYAAESDSSTAKAAAYGNALEILRRLQKHMNHDNMDCVLAFEIDGNKKVPLNASIFNGTHYGYFLDFEIGFFANDLLC